MQRVDLKEKDLILDIKDNKIWGSRGDFIIGFKVEFKEKYTHSKEDFEAIHAIWQRAFKNLPNGTIIVKSDLYEKINYDSNILPQDNYLQECTANHFEGREYLKHNCFIYFVCTSINTTKNDSIKNPFNFPKLKTFKMEEDKISSFTDEINQTVDLINKSDFIRFKELEPKEINEYTELYFNFNRNYLTDLKVQKNKIEADDKIVGVFNLNNEKYFPDFLEDVQEDKDYSSKQEGFVFYEGIADRLTFSINCNHIYNQIIFLDDHKLHMNDMYNREKILKSSRKFSPENELGAEKLKSSREEITEDSNSRLIRASNSVIFWTDTKKEFNHWKMKIESEFRNIDIKPNYPQRTRLKNIYYNSFFANTSCLDNNSLYFSDLKIALNLFVNSTNYKNDKEGIILNDRISNLPVIFDFWDSDKRLITARNLMIIAPTGSGKSVTFNHICRQNLDKGIINVIIDLGDSYLKFAKLLPKEDVVLFKYKEGESLGLNPFLLSDKDYYNFESKEGVQIKKISTEKIQEVCEFIWVIIKQGEHISMEERTSLRKIVSLFYDAEDIHTFQNFYDFIKNLKDNLHETVGIEDKKYFDVEQFLHSGSDFIDNGLYSFLFADDEDKSTQFIGKKLIIFELDAIKDNPLLLTIMLQTISETINKTIWQDKSKKGFVFFDEFAKQIKMPQVLSTVSYYYQAIRKQNGGVGIVLQTLNQLPDDPMAKSIIDNTETFIFLPASKEKYTGTIEKLELSSHVESQLKSLSNNFSCDKPYSELLIKRNGYAQVFRIELAKEVFLAFQTEGELHEKMMKLFEKYGTMEQAIKEIMKN